MASSYPPLGSRIVLWGRGGKTSLARALNEKLDLPWLEMDAVRWLPGWQERDDGEFRAVIEQWLEDHSDGWILDGQYGSTLGDMLQRADTVIWLDLPFRIAYWRIVKRSLQRAWDGQVVCGDNVETWRHLLTSRNSLPYFYLRRLLIGGHWKRQIVAREALLDEAGSHVSLTRLYSARELNEFYAAHDLVRPAD